MTDRLRAISRKKLLGTLAATWTAQAVYAVVKLGVPDLLQAGPATVPQLAARTAAHPGALRRVLRALTGAGLFREDEPGTFTLTAAGELLCAGVPGSVRLNVLMQGDEIFRSFGEIMHTMRTGRPAFEHVYGAPFYEYLQAHPQAARVFHQSMGDEQAPPAVAGCDFTGVHTVVDVGGGNGVLLAGLLSAYPRLHGVLADLPEAVHTARPRLAEFGDRVTYHEESFFDGVPPGGEVYVLSRVLHNWGDERAVELLHQVRAAHPQRIIVLEEFTGSGPVDLLMLVTLEGHERTAAEYRELLAKAGFAVTAERENVLEGVPA